MAERLGIYNGDLVRIVVSSSELDETMVPVDEKLEARLGPSEDAETVVVDPIGLTFSGLSDNDEGSYKVDYVSRSNGRQSGTIYIAKP